MGTTKRESLGYLDKGTLENIIAFNLANKTNKDKQVKFVETNAELFNRNRSLIEEKEDENVLENF